MSGGVGAALQRAARDLAYEADTLTFSPPVAYVYNPLRYAWAPHREYLERARASVETILVGMNPGPWGMLQTGVPFGDTTMVREWLLIDGDVQQPERIHPKRPVDGFACRRSEVSGRRVWGWARARYGTPDRFFARFFLLNYCPLSFFAADGRNITPDRLRIAERRPLLAVCDRFLMRAAQHLQPTFALGVGRFAEQRVAAVLGPSGVKTGGVPHPSPANARANRDWGGAFEKALTAAGVALP